MKAIPLFFLASALAAGPRAPIIQWEGWSDDIFSRAARENKLVVLDLEAVWCHWCHVMDEKTYSDPKVIKLMNEKFLAIRVDQDSRPDLSNRYEDYGWPATIVFDGKGTELAKRSGFIEPKKFLAMLQGFVKRPKPEPAAVAKGPAEFAASPLLAEPIAKQLLERLSESYDDDEGSWGDGHKFLLADNLELVLRRARAGDQTWAKRARQTLDANLALLDPVWGGVYQYSTDGDWKHPHFEKIMATQAANLRLYAAAAVQFGEPKYLAAAKSIAGYLKAFLTSPQGAFYTSQDADVVPGQHSEGYFKLKDADRRKAGVPAVDKQIYARENGWAIEALAVLHAASGDAAALDAANRAAMWIMGARRITGSGGFHHAENDPAGPYLGDTLAMGRAFLALYEATADRQWLTRADEAAQFIDLDFRQPDGKRPGYITAKPSRGFVPAPTRDENVPLARFANLLHHYTGTPAHKEMAERAMRFVATPPIALRYPTGSALLAAEELAVSPVHVTVVGPRGDAASLALYKAALRFPDTYKRLDWWDRDEKPPPNTKVTFPELKEAAAFLCTGTRCSLPIRKPEDLTARLEKADRAG